METTTISSSIFCDLLEQYGHDFYAGVPCSIFNALYRELNQRRHLRYVPATREDSAVGMAVGAYMAGRSPVVIMQNSGLGYSLNAFTSLVLLYRVPLLVLVSWRGYEGKDAPEHILMGAKMLDILRDVGISYVLLGEGDIPQQIKEAEEAMKKENQPIFAVVRSGVLK